MVEVWRNDSELIFIKSIKINFKNYLASGVQSGKSRLLTCLIGKTQLLWTQCRGIGPHLAGRGKSHGFSRVVAGTWGIFSSYSGDVHSKL